MNSSKKKPMTERELVENFDKIQEELADLYSKYLTMEPLEDEDEDIDGEEIDDEIDVPMGQYVEPDWVFVITAAI
jgi:hypothetical protein